MNSKGDDASLPCLTGDADPDEAVSMDTSAWGALALPPGEENTNPKVASGPVSLSPCPSRSSSSGVVARRLALAPRLRGGPPGDDTPAAAPAFDVVAASLVFALRLRTQSRSFASRATTLVCASASCSRKKDSSSSMESASSPSPP